MQGEGEEEAIVYKKAHLGESLGQLYYHDEVGHVLLLGQQFTFIWCVCWVQRHSLQHHLCVYSCHRSVGSREHRLQGRLQQCCRTFCVFTSVLQLKMWVERGKEDEARAEKAKLNAPPPSVGTMSAASSSTSLNTAGADAAAAGVPPVPGGSTWTRCVC
jgi:hypothetical protein